MQPITPPQRYMHIRLDSFLASIVEKENPKLQGRPIVVVETTNGEEKILSCNQSAKKLGIQKGDLLDAAQKRCAWVAVFDADIDLAKKYAQRFLEILCRFSTRVYPHNRLDEAYLELSSESMAASSPEEFAATIQRSIKMQIGLSASIGIARTRSVAWTASHYKQPEGITSVPIGNERAFLYPLPLTQLFSMGQRSREFLAQKNIRTIGQLAQLPQQWLVAQFGSAGYELLALSHGRDIQVQTERAQQKSISRSLKFEAPTSNHALVETTVQHLSQKALKALQSQGRQAGTLVVQVTDLYGKSHQTHARLQNNAHSFQRHLQHVFRQVMQRVTTIRSVAVQLNALLDSPQQLPTVLWQSRPIQSALLGLQWRSQHLPNTAQSRFRLQPSSLMTARV